MVVVEDGWWVVALDGTDRGNKRAGELHSKVRIVVIRGKGAGGTSDA